MKYPRPKIFVSACLEFEKVRYNGQVVPCKIVRDLKPFADFIKVCPEVEIGLGVPREPIRVVKKDNDLRLIQHKTEKDVTDSMTNFTKQYLDNIEKVDGFILKEESPSMGPSEIKVYSDIDLGSAVVDWCAGFFGGEIIKRYRGFPIEEAKRLKNKKIRNHFLTKLFFFAGFRETDNNDIEIFLNQNKLLIDFYNIDKNIKIDKKNRLNSFRDIFSKPPGVKGIIKYYKRFESAVEDDKEYNELMNNYEHNKVGYDSLFQGTKLVIKDEEILKDRFFEPYPSELIERVEEDRNRDYWKNK